MEHDRLPADKEWWALLGLPGALRSLALFTLLFTPWWMLAIALSAALSVIRVVELLT